MVEMVDECDAGKEDPFVNVQEWWENARILGSAINYISCCWLTLAVALERVHATQGPPFSPALYFTPEEF